MSIGIASRNLQGQASQTQANRMTRYVRSTEDAISLPELARVSSCTYRPSPSPPAWSNTNMIEQDNSPSAPNFEGRAPYTSHCNTGMFHYQHVHLSGHGQSVARE